MLANRNCDFEGCAFSAELAALRAERDTAKDNAAMWSAAVVEHQKLELAALRAERVAELEAALRQAIEDLRTVGNDYPGSSCQIWCTQAAKAHESALGASASAPVAHCEEPK